MSKETLDSTSSHAPDTPDQDGKDTASSPAVSGYTLPPLVQEIIKPALYLLALPRPAP
ncbi:MAG: hypothetical protein R3E95_04890 [Thiolinea sp.]